MIYAITERQTKKLLDLPETGMGFQIVKAENSDTFHSSKFLVLNAEIAIDVDNDLVEFKSFIAESEIHKLARNSKEWNVFSSTIKVVPQSLVRDKVLVAETKSLRRSHVGGGAMDNDAEEANGEEMFVRLSAYKNDRRIDFENGCLCPGSYRATLKDYLNCVHTHDDPIERYALPTEDEIEWAFFIQPAEGDEFQRGVVQPANGRRGGDEEAYFENGTSKNTLLSINEYGEKP